MKTSYVKIAVTALAATLILSGCGNKQENVEYKDPTGDKKVEQNQSVADPNAGLFNGDDVGMAENEEFQLVDVKGSSAAGEASSSARVPMDAYIADDGRNTSITWDVPVKWSDADSSLGEGDGVVKVSVSVSHFNNKDDAQQAALAASGVAKDAVGDASSATVWGVLSDDRHGEGKVIQRFKMSHAEALGNNWFLTINTICEYNHPNNPAEVPELTDDQLDAVYQWYKDITEEMLSKTIVRG